MTNQELTVQSKQTSSEKITPAARAQIEKLVREQPGVKSLLFPPGIRKYFGQPPLVAVKQRTHWSGGEELQVDLYLECDAKFRAGQVGAQVQQRVEEYLAEEICLKSAFSVHVHILRIAA